MTQVKPSHTNPPLGGSAARDERLGRGGGSELSMSEILHPPKKPLASTE